MVRDMHHPERQTGLGGDFGQQPAGAIFWHFRCCDSQQRFLAGQQQRVFCGEFDADAGQLAAIAGRGQSGRQPGECIGQVGRSRIDWVLGESLSVVLSARA